MNNRNENEKSLPVQDSDDEILDSRLIAYNAYMMEEDTPSLLVLVEDVDDTPFWKQVFSCVSHLYASVDVWPLYEAALNNQKQYDVGGSLLTATGKDALMKVEGLGKNKMVAVDCDYDLLVDKMHTYTDRIREGKYVQHTIYHSIENHLLDDARFVKSEEVQCLLNEVEDFVYYLLCEERLQVAENGIEKRTPRKLTVDGLRSIIGTYQYHPSSFTTDIADLFAQLNSELSPTVEAEYLSVKADCTRVQSAGLDVWKILQGHTLFEFIEKIVTYKMLAKRQDEESVIREDDSISGQAKQSKIHELRISMLGDCKNESEKFKKDVYSCSYLNLESDAIKKMQEKIKLDAYKK